MLEKILRGILFWRNGKRYEEVVSCDLVLVVLPISDVEANGPTRKKRKDGRGKPRALTPTQEREVRARYKAGEGTYTKLAGEYKVSRQTIMRTVTRRRIRR